MFIYTTSTLLIPGNHSVEFPDDSVRTLESNEHIHVEQDGEVRTQ